MSNVPLSRRQKSHLVAEHSFWNLRNQVTNLMLNKFGFSKEKFEKQIEHYREAHKNCDHVDEVVERWRMKCQEFNDWFIKTEREAVSEMLRNIDSEFTFANSIYPSDTPAKIAEYCERRRHMDAAISNCYVLKREINYILRTLPVDLNKYNGFAEAIDRQVALYKGVRTADNRFLKPKYKKEKGKAK